MAAGLARREELGSCPSCGKRSTSRHGWHERRLQDLPAQGAGVTVTLRMRRWRCRNKACQRRTFVEQLPEVAAPQAHRTQRAEELVHLFGHSVGGRPSERMMKRIGMPTSDDTILRHLKRRAKERRARANVRVVGIDDWAWCKGSTYGTIIVDLERRAVIDLLPVRSAGATADWLKQYPDIEMISRDRCGSFAQGAYEGAPQARQVADRFHILQNLREAIQAQLSRAAGSSARPLLPPDVDDERAAVISSSPRDKHGGAEHRCLTRMANQRSRQALFDRVRALHREGRSVSDIVRQTRFDRRTIAKWIRADALPQRNGAAPRTVNGGDKLCQIAARKCTDLVKRKGAMKPRNFVLPCRFHKDEFATVFRGISGSPLGGRLCSWPASFSRGQSARLHGQFLKPRKIAGEMAQSKTQDAAACAAPSEDASRRSGDGPVDLADRRRGAMRQAARFADKRSGGDG